MVKKVRKFIHFTAAVAAILCTAILLLVIYFNSQMPSSFYVTKGSEFELENIGVLKGGEVLDYEKTSLANKSKGTSQTVELRLLGVIPVKTTHVSVISEQMLTPGGTAFGIKLFTKGVIVVDINNIETTNGLACPAKLAGILKGDIILTINGIEVTSNEEVSSIISQSSGTPLAISLMRDEKTINTSITPALSCVDGKYKGGLWVRDSSAGIGTITYYDRKAKIFAGLGHGICDSDTGKIMPLATGEICDVQINSVLKGQVGSPGELRGSFISSESNGELLLNNETGIFGTIEENPNNFSSIPVKLKQEVVTGKAKIICTLGTDGPKEYEINIDRIDLNPKAQTKNMIISVTDPALLEKTGGIVQGMSGSPIIQDGRLIGAVTHVFVNNPTKGYGIFVENMINFSNKLANAS
ncbi:MAG: SpoIVB peptidase [Oscillospiraceae bacterium]